MSERTDRAACSYHVTVGLVSGQGIEINLYDAVMEGYVDLDPDDEPTARDVLAAVERALSHALPSGRRGTVRIAADAIASIMVTPTL